MEIKKALIVGLISLTAGLSSVAQAAGHTVSGTAINEMFIVSDGAVRVNLTNMDHGGGVVECAGTVRNDYFYLLPTHRAYTQILAAMLTAKANDKTVSFWIIDGDSCVNEGHLGGVETAVIDAVTL